MTNEMLTIGHNLMTARIRLNLRQIDVAKELGVNQCTIWNYEQGRTLPANSKLQALCRIYGLDYEAARARVEAIIIQRWENT